LIPSLVLGGLWAIIHEQKQTSSLGRSKDGTEHFRRDLSRIKHTSQRIEQNGDPSNHEISKQKAGYQPLRLDSKLRAWGAVDRHNIPKG